MAIVRSAVLESQLDRLSVPGPGRTIATAAEERAVYVRGAVRLIEDSLRTASIESAFQELFAPRYSLTSPVLSESTARRSAWALVNVYLAARKAGAVASSGTFMDAEEWFLGALTTPMPRLSALVPEDASRAALASLSQLCLDHQFQELLPYILEVHGPGSRRSVMRDPATRESREGKRRQGVFYTPADVAEFMADVVLSEHGGEMSQIRCLDPSCGTGVFLLALLRTIERHEGKGLSKFSYATRCLFGIDLSPLAVEGCTFAILNECLPEISQRNIAPWSAWHALRLNIVAADALRIVSNGASAIASGLASLREQILAQLLEGNLVVRPKRIDLMAATEPTEMADLLTNQGNELGSIFPEVASGFDIIIGNPPYSELGQRNDRTFLQTEYASAPIKKNNQHLNTYPLFIEMMWRLTRSGHNASALVVPLSIAYHQGEQYRSCRSAMAIHGGLWRCAFFDREPHALFGEDVKTRNAILFRTETATTPKRDQPADLGTGPLLKWTSRTRDRLFASVRFTPLGRVPFTNGLPKLSGEAEAKAFLLLSRNSDTLRTLASNVTSCSLYEVGVTPTSAVFVGNTAYNFLNVFRSLPADFQASGSLSNSAVICLEFPNSGLADIGFAILSSRLVYWLWRVQGDGFHVSQRFVEHVPFGRSSFDAQQLSVLQNSGRRLWDAVKDDVVVSINGGKRSIAYRPLAFDSERDLVDAVLVDAAKLPSGFDSLLRDFVHTTVVVDPTDHRRRHLKSYFES